jgi:hypothetical protein
MSNKTVDDWLKSLEFKNWTYQSFLILPTITQNNAPPETDVDSKKWAMGKLTLTFLVVQKTRETLIEQWFSKNRLC